MKVILTQDVDAIDASLYRNPNLGFNATIPAGSYVLERVSNPFSMPGYWLVVFGTQIGREEGTWRLWTQGRDGQEPIVRFEV